MTIDVLDQLAQLIKQEREASLSSWRQQVRRMPSARHLDVPTLNDHVPSLLDELAAALQSKSDQTIPQALIESSPPAHGLQRGLGLAIVKTFTEAHGGKVSVETKEGVGSMFRFSLPTKANVAA